MDFATTIGLIISFLSLGIGIFAAGLNLLDIINIAAVFITIGGSFAVILISNPLELTFNIGKVYRKTFRVPDFDAKEKILQIISFSEKARRDGLLALEDDMDDLDDEFMKKALQLVVDGTDPEIVQNVMQIELDSMEGRHSRARGWFESLAVLAPAFGMIGTLVGLIGMLRNLGGDATIIGRGMSAALITTLYGSFIANVFAIPTANKLRVQTEEELLIKQMMIEGTLSIQAGDNPRIVQEKLINYLPPEMRSTLSDKESA